MPAPAWTKRPTAKDGVRAVAETMRRQGHSYPEMQQVVGVSTSSLSMWLKDVPLTEEHRIAIEQRRVAGRARTTETLRGRRMAREQHTRETAAGQIEELAESELFVAGVVAYWAEGAKGKPWSASPSVVFMNSDPGMICLFLAWLSLLGIGPDRLSFRVAIHESGDVDRALLGGGGGRTGQPLHADDPQAPQPHDGAEERRRQLSRLLDRAGPEKYGIRTADRRMVRRHRGHAARFTTLPVV